MSGGGKGGKQSTEVKVPEWLEGAARQNIAKANEIAKIGYVPYFGPDVAAFTPMQQASFQNTADAASAFGMSAPANPTAGMPQPQTFAGGVQGYSSAPMYQQSLQTLRAAQPGQYAALQAPFINPVTGAEPAAPYGSGAGSMGGKGGAEQVLQAMTGGVAAQAAPAVAQSYSSNSNGGWPTGAPGGVATRSSGGTGSFGLPDPMGGRVSSAGGYTSIRDMFDGGGPGKSGSTFSGGPLSNTLNRVGVSPSGSKKR